MKSKVVYDHIAAQSAKVTGQQLAITSITNHNLGGTEFYQTEGHAQLKTCTGVRHMAAAAPPSENYLLLKTQERSREKLPKFTQLLVRASLSPSEHRLNVPPS